MDASLSPSHWLETTELLPDFVDLDMGYCSCRIRSNSADLLDTLSDYFASVVGHVSKPDYTVTAIESAPLDVADAFTDWKREPGKTGRKDSYINLEQARLIRKVRTGMVFYQGPDSCIAIGPCLANDNQVINFINNQFMTWLQQDDWLICHAACVVSQGKALAVAGFSGGGKSTLMLEMLEREDVKFLTNDRLFIKNTDNGIQATGIPKQPRINPGTIVNNPRLKPMLSEQQQQAFLALPKNELWELEQKFDADIDALYGDDRIQYQAPLQALLILSWSRDKQEDVQLNRVNLHERPELLDAVMKSPGPFYQGKDGQFITDDFEFDQQAYLTMLDCIEVYEATGGINFQQLAEQYLAISGEKQ